MTIMGELRSQNNLRVHKTFSSAQDSPHNRIEIILSSVVVDLADLIRWDVGGDPIPKLQWVMEVTAGIID